MIRTSYVSGQQVTLPLSIVEELGLAPGDELRVTADGDRIVLSREEGLAERRRRALREVAGEPARRLRARLSRQAARRVALIVLDASVLIALLDPADAFHNAATRAIEKHAADDLKIPASAYSESVVGPARRGQAEAAKSAIASLLLDIVPITDQIAEDAAELRARHAKLRLPDALVIATGSALEEDEMPTVILGSPGAGLLVWLAIVPSGHGGSRPPGPLGPASTDPT